MISSIHIVLLVTIIFFFSFAIYDEFILPYRKGKSLLTVKLKNGNRIDGIIFIALVCIVFFQQGLSSNDSLLAFLLGFLLLISFYIYFIRKPKLILKKKGFFFTIFFIPYQRIQAMNLTEDGVLVVTLEVKNIFIQTYSLDDLEKIYSVLADIDYTPS